MLLYAMLEDEAGSAGPCMQPDPIAANSTMQTADEQPPVVAMPKQTALTGTSRLHLTAEPLQMRPQACCWQNHTAVTIPGTACTAVC